MPKPSIADLRRLRRSPPAALKFPESDGQALTMLRQRFRLSSSAIDAMTIKRSPTELFALAQISRLSGRKVPAGLKRALRRFPESPAKALASFVLVQSANARIFKKPDAVRATADHPEDPVAALRWLLEQKRIEENAKRLADLLRR